MKILLVEDDERICEAIAEDLRDQNYVVEIAHNGEEAEDLIQAFPYDIVVLDIMLPKVDGLTLCRRLRSKGNSIPILMLTGRDALSDRVEGLDAGADDYLVKPFELQELSARIRALLRRGNTVQTTCLQWQALLLDPKYL